MPYFIKRPFIFTFFLLCLFIPYQLYSSETIIKKGDTIDLNKCQDIALKMHPAITAYLYAIKSREAQLGQAKSNYYPKIDASGEFIRNFKINDTRDPYFSMAYTTTYNTTHGKLSLNQNIYDFGRTSTDVRLKRIFCI